MKGLKPGTIFALQQFRFVVDSTDKNGNSFIKQTGARSVKEHKEMQQEDKANKKIKTKKKSKGVGDE